MPIFFHHGQKLLKKLTSDELKLHLLTKMGGYMQIVFMFGPILFRVHIFDLIQN